MKCIKKEQVIARVRLEGDRIISVEGCVRLGKGKGHIFPERSGEAEMETFVGK